MQLDMATKQWSQKNQSKAKSMGGERNKPCNNIIKKNDKAVISYTSFNERIFCVMSEQNPKKQIGD